jgi:NADH:ubiquinone oxidoreductase subunit F (NADH-binding)
MAPAPLDAHRRLLHGAPADLAAHLHRHGPLPLDAYPGRSGRERLIDAVDRSGLRGRGGAGFPTGRKLRAVAAGKGPATVIVNGCEGEPVSGKDRLLFTVAPHLVLDGAVLAAYAVGAAEVVVCLHQGDALGFALTAALADRADRIPVRLQAVPARYVASEESALVNLIETGDARPTSRPPRPDQRGVHGRATLIANVETLAHLALVARHGPDWFRTTGTADTPGTVLVTVTGAVRHAGVHEVAAGTPIGQVLDLAGVAPDAQAVLVGGIAGTWLPLPFAAAVPLAHGDLAAAGAALGVGALFVLPATACGLAETARVVHHLAGESAGQCGPCMFGLPALADDLAAVVCGDAAGGVDARLRHRLAIVDGRGACRHPDGAVRVAASALRVFTADLHRHLTGHPCVHIGQSHVPLRRRNPS